MEAELKDHITITETRGKGKDKKTTEERIYIHVEKDESGINRIYVAPSGGYGLHNALSVHSVATWDAIKSKVDRMIARLEECDI